MNMGDRLLLATRKGLFFAARREGKWGIERSAFLGDPVSSVLPMRDGRTLYAALNLGHFGVKLHRSSDAGVTWNEVAAPAYPAGMDADARDGKGPSVQQVWTLEAAGDGVDALWAGTIPGGLFRSTDGGGTWSLNEPLWKRPERADWFGGGYDQPGIHSICVGPDAPKRLVVGVSCGGVWTSDDGGETWALGGKGLVAAYMPSEKRDDPRIQDPHRVVSCPANPNVLWTQHHNGVFRSTDRGATWSEVTSIEPSRFGFAVAVHPRDPWVAWFVPAVKDDRRIPVDAKLVVARTRDGGATCQVLRNGLPQEHAYDLVYRHALDVDATGARLAFGSTTGSAFVSEDGGDSWRVLSKHLPPVYQVRFG